MERTAELKISLILPAYNTSQYLEKCVDSCINQDLSPDEYEIIIVNDGSTDNTEAIAKTLLKKSKNIVILSQENQGLSMARNNGADIARGKYLWFIDSDDYIAENCLKSLIGIVERNNLDMFGVGPSIPFVPEFPSNFKDSEDILPIMSGREWTLSEYGFCGAWGYIFKTEFFFNTGKRFYPGLYFEDSELIPKLCFISNRISSLSKFSCYAYVQREGSIMNSSMNEKKILDFGKIVNSYRLFIENDLDKSDKEIVVHFEAIESSHFIAGIVNIAKIKGGRQLLDKFLKQLIHRPNRIYAKGLLRKSYQLLILRHPYLFLYLKKIL